MEIVWQKTVGVAVVNVVQGVKESGDETKAIILSLDDDYRQALDDLNREFPGVKEELG
jgi:hypothetical protein